MKQNFFGNIYTVRIPFPYGNLYFATLQLYLGCHQQLSWQLNHSHHKNEWVGTRSAHLLVLFFHGQVQDSGGVAFTDQKWTFLTSGSAHACELCDLLGLTMSVKEMDCVFYYSLYPSRSRPACIQHVCWLGYKVWWTFKLHSPWPPWHKFLLETLASLGFLSHLVSRLPPWLPHLGCFCGCHLLYPSPWLWIFIGHCCRRQR